VFFNECSESRNGVIGRTEISVHADEDLLARFDGSTAVFYRRPSIAFPGEKASLEAGDAAGSEVSEPAPVLLSLPRPVYPAEALKHKVEGTVIVEALVGPDGRVQSIDLVDGGIAILNPAALDAVRNARFQPFQGAGVGSIRVRVPMRFSIEGTRTVRQEYPGWNVGGLVNADEGGGPPRLKTEK
jgi:TonB family protein